MFATSQMTTQQILKALHTAFGPRASRQQMTNWCFQNNCNLPNEAISYPTEKRGVYSLTQFATIGEANVAIAQLESKERTIEEIQSYVSTRFKALDRLAIGVVDGVFRSAVVSGNPGIGKTHTLEYILESARDDGKIRYEMIKGQIRATGLYKALYVNRFKDHVLVFDDADAVFGDETALNILKVALDSRKKRLISWRAETRMETNDGEPLPTEFEFEGSVIFISNLDFDNECKANNRFAVHMQALMSRSLYINLNLDSIELNYRINQVIEETDMLYSLGVDEPQKKVILDYFWTNSEKFREKSLRTIVKLCQIIKSSDSVEDFHLLANATALDPLLVRKSA